MILRLRRLCSCTPRSLSVLGSDARNASRRSFTLVHMRGSEGELRCVELEVFLRSSLETPGSEDAGISLQRHGCI